MKRSSNNRGVTLIEAVASITVLAIALPPLTALFTEVAASTPDDIYQRAALIYADALMEEIVSMPFEDPQAPAGSFGAEEGSRANYDDIDDYDGLTEAALRHVDGSALDVYSGFDRRVSVTNVLASDPDAVTPEPDGSTPFKRIEVSVGWSGGRGGVLRLVTLRSHLAFLEASSTPLDGVASSGTVINTGNDKFELLLVNPMAIDLEIESFSLDASRATPDVEKFEFASVVGDFTTVWDDRAPLPTGMLNLTDGDPDERIIPANGAAGALFQFRDEITPGPITFRLVLYFTDGTRSTILIPMEWLP